MDVQLKALTALERQLLAAVRGALNIDAIAERLELTPHEVRERLAALEQRLVDLGTSMAAALSNEAP